MNIYLLFIVLSSLLCISFKFKNFNKNYLSKDNTMAIKGFFILIVFYSHLVSYIGIHSNDNIILDFRNFLGQLMVTMFLFYSGYGVYESIKKNKKKYVEKMPQKRILKTLLNFDIAIVSFIIVNIILNRKYPLKNILLSFIGFEGIGNSNWYIFAILNLYIITYFSFSIFNNKNEDKKAIFMCFLLTIVFILFMNYYKSDYWFNTVLCFPFGLFYSYHKENFEKKLFNNKNYIISLFLALFTFNVLKKYEFSGYIYYELLSVSFSFLIVLLTMKINFNSPILKWFGKNLFWVYILQRIPMLVLKNIGYTNHPYKFALIAFISTCIMAYIYQYVITKITNLFLKLKKS